MKGIDNEATQKGMPITKETREMATKALLEAGLWFISVKLTDLISAIS